MMVLSIIFITATMNKNQRGSYDATRAGNRNNINIQINFNMKDKNQGFVGKKIDNYLEVEHKNTSKNDNYPKITEEIKKIKKKPNDPSLKMEKEKIFDTPVKQRNTENNKMVKFNTSKTPEKRDNSRREERSKSTNQKLVKRKNAKSLENIKTGFKYTRNKGKSPQSSEEKSRSRSKSSKKVIKSNETSTKNLMVFSNSGIKNRLSNAKSGKSRERMMSGTSKKNLKEDDHEKIKKFMEQKKKKQKMEKNRHVKEDRGKKDKIQAELRKVEAERKANASKPITISKKMLMETKERLPIYCFDDEFDQSGEYDKLQKEASDLIHESPPRENIMEGIPIIQEKESRSSSKKSIKKKKNELVYRYLNGSINHKQLLDLNKAVIDIQRCWRGYLSRKDFVKKLSDESIKIRYMRNNIQNKRGHFWNSEDNSIVNLQRDSTIKINESGQSSLNYLNFNSNHQSEFSREHPTSDQKNRAQKFKKLEIQVDEGQESKDKSQRSEKQTFENSKMLKEIEQLRKMLEQQNMKYRSLQQQNQNLRNNMRIISLKESRQIKPQISQDMINSKDYIEIRMPKKIESPPNQVKIEEITEESTKPKGTDSTTHKQQPEMEHSGSFDVSEYKKNLQSFECSSPSNARLEEQLRKLKNKNIQNIFLKKELKIEQKYEKKAAMFDKMLNDRIFSPRTYNFKKKQLDEKLKGEKEEIKQKIEEAKVVIGYIEDLSSEQSDREGKKCSEDSTKQFVRTNDEIKPNFKKEKEKMNQDNSSGKVQKEAIFHKQPPFDNNSHSSYSSEDDRIYKKYWTDDIEEVHKHTLQITKKIEQALKASSQEESSNKKQPEDIHKEYSSNEAANHQSCHSCDGKQPEKKKQSCLSHSKSSDLDVECSSPKLVYQNYMEDIKELPTEPEKKALQIFNKIDLAEHLQSKSDQQLQNSHDNICKLLNERPLSADHSDHHHDQKHNHENLFISEAEFNKKKKKEQELSRSSSFEKSNKSLSVNNSSHVECRGFITNLTFIKEFCISICEFIRNSETYKEEFIDKISVASKLDYDELLRSYRITVNGEVKNNYNTFQDQYVYPYFKIISAKVHTISHDLFNDFMKVYEEERAGQPQWNDPTMNKSTKEMREFFLISIIDNFNESLQFEKPGSVYGEPLPWMNNFKHLKNHSIGNLKNMSNVIENKYNSGSEDEDQTEQEKTLDRIFGASIAKIIQWGSCLCGFIADPMPMQMGDSQIANLSDQQLNSIRENRVGLMLEKWLLDQQQKMTNSGSEYTEVLLCLAERIIDTLIVECSDEVGEVFENN